MYYLYYNKQIKAYNSFSLLIEYINKYNIKDFKIKKIK